MPPSFFCYLETDLYLEDMPSRLTVFGHMTQCGQSVVHTTPHSTLHFPTQTLPAESAGTQRSNPLRALLQALSGDRRRC